MQLHKYKVTCLAYGFDIDHYRQCAVEIIANKADLAKKNHKIVEAFII